MTTLMMMCDPKWASGSRDYTHPKKLGNTVVSKLILSFGCRECSTAVHKRQERAVRVQKKSNYIGESLTLISLTRAVLFDPSAAALSFIHDKIILLHPRLKRTPHKMGRKTKLKNSAKAKAITRLRNVTHWKIKNEQWDSSLLSDYYVDCIHAQRPSKRMNVPTAGHERTVVFINKAGTSILGIRIFLPSTVEGFGQGVLNLIYDNSGYITHTCMEVELLIEGDNTIQ